MEQGRFLEKVVNRRLPLKAEAYEMTRRITRIDARAANLEVHGKIGTGYPGSDGNYDPAHAYA